MREKRTESSPLVKNPALWHWFVYLLVAENTATEFVVKVGASSDPLARYNALLCGMPFKSMLLYTPVRTRARMFGLESTLHRQLAGFHSRAEWFRVNNEDKSAFHAIVGRAYLDIQGEPLQWFVLHDDQATATAAIHSRMFGRTKFKHRRAVMKRKFQAA